MKSGTICIAGAAFALLIWRKPTSIRRKTTKWVVTAAVGIGIRIMALARSFEGKESFTAHSVGAFIRRMTWAWRRFSSSATTTMILIETFVTFAMGTTVIASTLPTGATMVAMAGTTLATEGTMVTTVGITLLTEATAVTRSITNLTTTITSITAPIAGLAIPSTAALTVLVQWRRAATWDSMEAKASTADLVAEASMAGAALSGPPGAGGGGAGRGQAGGVHRGGGGRVGHVVTVAVLIDGC